MLGRSSISFISARMPSTTSLSSVFSGIKSSAEVMLSSIGACKVNAALSAFVPDKKIIVLRTLPKEGCLATRAAALKTAALSHTANDSSCLRILDQADARRRRRYLSTRSEVNLYLSRFKGVGYSTHCIQLQPNAGDNYSSGPDRIVKRRGRRRARRLAGRSNKCSFAPSRPSNDFMV